MMDRARFLGAGAALLLAAAGFASDQRRAPARVYTDEDLARVSDRRGETGVESKPAAAAPMANAVVPPSAGARGEQYWRAEAARVRQRVEPWRNAASDLRTEIEARRSEPDVRPYTDPKVRALQRRLAALEARIHEAEDRFEERARRAGALPGWLR